MNIIFIDINRDMTTNWEIEFSNTDCSNIRIVTDEFSNFMRHNKVDCIISPANSFGLMDGGYDKAIIDYFGNDLQAAVQNYIIENYFGEQPIGSSFIIDIPNSDKKLIHTPTMQTPSIIKDPMIIYTCFRATLICALKNLHKDSTILVPAFGGCTGRVPYNIIAKYMKIAYFSTIYRPNKLDWNYAIFLKDLLN